MLAGFVMHDVPRPFRTPSRVWYGDGAAGSVFECAQELGIAPGPVLLVTDAVVDRLGLARGIAGALETAGFNLHHYNDIPGEPSAEVADRAAEVARRLGPLLVVAVGGGSVIDVAKLSAALARNPGKAVDYTHLVGRKFVEPAVPTILVPTTAGTGAETSQNAVVTVGSRKAFANKHPQLLASGIILDPLLTHSLPASVTAHTGLDALSHCVEAVLSTNAGALSDLAALQGIATIVRSLPRAYASGDDAEARAEMLLGAFMGGLALNAGMVLGHSLAYTIANRLHLSHGLTCALALPYAMAYNREAAAARLGRIGEAGGWDSGDPVARTQSLCHDLGIPEALRGLGLGREALPDLVAECLEFYPRPNNPRPLEAEPLLSLYTAMWEGRPAAAWRR
jgi:alcohol dehydrogenase class IV